MVNKQANSSSGILEDLAAALRKILQPLSDALDKLLTCLGVSLCWLDER